MKIPSFLAGVIVLTSSINRADGQARIVGGSDAPPNRYSYYTSLYSGSVQESNFICGASLIARDMVITAAHCDQSSFSVEVGNEDIGGDGQTFQVERKFLHAGYNPVSIKNDIMIMQLNGGADVDPVQLNFDSSVPETGEELEAIGLGRTSQTGPLPDKLQFVDVDEFDFEVCKDRYSRFGGGFFDDIFDDFFGGMEREEQVCAGGDGEKDSCFGDSGGPLILSGGSASADRQIGLTSYGRGCAVEDYPGVYTRISGYENWIKTRVCEYSNFKPDYCDGFVPDAEPDDDETGGGDGGGGGFFCFSGETTVEVEHIGSVPMRELKVGDSILVGPNMYQPVYGFGHYNKEKETKFLLIEATHEDSNMLEKLEVTRDHLLFAEGGEIVPASALTEGMKVMFNPDQGEGLATIQNIKMVKRNGFYAPFTSSGKLVVNNGFHASCFVALNGESKMSLLGGLVQLHYQHLSILFESPRRLMYSLGIFSKESYDSDGMSNWNALPLAAHQWLMSQNAIVLHVGVFTTISVLAIVAALEMVLVATFTSSVLTMALSFLFLLVIARRSTESNFRLKKTS